MLERHLTAIALCFVAVAGGLVGPGRAATDEAQAAMAIPTHQQVAPAAITVTTRDGRTLDGVYRAGDRRNVGLLFVHGFGGTFEGPPVAILAATLAERGYATLSLNMRDAGCCVFTTLFEDNATDIDAGVQLLKEAGSDTVVAVGHSLGANRVTYYQVQMQDPAVRAMVILSGVGNTYQVASAFDTRGAGERALQEANRRLAENDSLDELLEVPLGAYGTFYYTPASLVSNGGPNTNSDMFRWLPEIALPILFFQGTTDTFLRFQRPELARDISIRSPRADIVYVDGGDHGFTGHEAELTDRIDGWLSEVLSPTP